jgi:hypothetical protein
METTSAIPWREGLKRLGKKTLPAFTCMAGGCRGSSDRLGKSAVEECNLGWLQRSEVTSGAHEKGGLLPEARHWPGFFIFTLKKPGNT